MKITEKGEWKIALAFLVLMGMCFLSYKVYKYFYPDVPGYCYSQKRFLSDEEFIRIAVRKSLTGPLHWQPDIDGSEASISNFYRDHPGCCRVLRKAAGEHWDDRWNAIVGMRFKTKEKSLSRNKPDEYETFTVMDECGEILFPD